jgi:hypothetical protein
MVSASAKAPAAFGVDGQGMLILRGGFFRQPGTLENLQLDSPCGNYPQEEEKETSHASGPHPDFICRLNSFLRFR